MTEALLAVDDVPRIDPHVAAGRLADLGFLADPDFPDHAGPASLLVALRPQPTLRHFDPEQVEYWVTDHGRGVHRQLAIGSPLPLELEFSWGLIRIVDRLKVTNEYLTFGGWLAAQRVGDAVIATFTSPAPLLRRGGHSQGWDVAADSIGAYFGRMLLAVDYQPGFEQAAAAAGPLDRYAAFVADAAARFRSSLALRATQPDQWALIRAEEQRLRAVSRGAWIRGAELRRLALT